MKKLLTDKQALAVQGIKDRCQEAGLAIPTPQIVTSAHQAAYKTKTRDGARAIASRNLQKPEFREALQLDSPEMRSEIGTIIQQGLRGELKLWPADREVFLACLKLAARINFAEKSETTVKTEAPAHDPRLDDLSREEFQREMHYSIDHHHYSWERDEATLRVCEACHPERAANQ